MVTILVVDDTAMVRTTMRKLLERAGYTVLAEASNGLTATNLYKKLNPDIVLMDIMTPDKHAMKALTNILEYDKQAKVIISISESHQRDLHSIKKAGAKDVLIKPISVDMLLKSVGKLTTERKNSPIAELLNKFKLN